MSHSSKYGRALSIYTCHAIKPYKKCEGQYQQCFQFDTRKSKFRFENKRHILEGIREGDFDGGGGVIRCSQLFIILNQRT